MPSRMFGTRAGRRAFALLILGASLLSGAVNALLATCGPFTDVAADAFCPFVLEIFYLGITTGTTATTYDPASNVSRLQMAAFLSRTVDRVLKRGGRRAALNQFWTTQNATVLGLTTVGLSPNLVACDGADIWVANADDNTVSRVRASDGKLLETWTGANVAYAVLSAMGKVFVTGPDASSKLYQIDPAQPAGAVTIVSSSIGASPFAIAFDGARIWTANGGASVSIVTPGVTIPWTVTTVTTGFSLQQGILWDGANIWTTRGAPAAILKLDSSGAILQTVTLPDPRHPIFDGNNIWVPNGTSASISVVRPSTGAILATLTANGLNQPIAGAFDGQRLLITDIGAGNVSLWKAADLTLIGVFALGTSPFGACSDGIAFWLTFPVTNKLARF